MRVSVAAEEEEKHEDGAEKLAIGGV